MVQLACDFLAGAIEVLLMLLHVYHNTPYCKALCYGKNVCTRHILPCKPLRPQSWSCWLFWYCQRKVQKPLQPHLSDLREERLSPCCHGQVTSKALSYSDVRDLSLCAEVHTMTGIDDSQAKYMGLIFITRPCDLVSCRLTFFVPLQTQRARYYDFFFPPGCFPLFFRSAD